MVEYYFEAPSTFINTIIGHSLRKVSFTKCTKKQTNKKKKHSYLNNEFDLFIFT